MAGQHPQVRFPTALGGMVLPGASLFVVGREPTGSAHVSETTQPESHGDSLTFLGGMTNLLPIDAGVARAGTFVPALSEIMKGDSP